MNEKLKDLRDYHGISQRELARRIGVGKTTISEIERGDRLPNVLTAIRIARALETTVEEIGEMENRETLLSYLERMLEKATEEQLRILYIAALHLL